MDRQGRFLVVVAGLVFGLLMDTISGQELSRDIVLESPAMQTGEAMPRDYTPDGRNLSPPLTWSNLPAGTQEVAIACADFGAGNPPPCVHWISYGVSPAAGGLPAGLPVESHEAMPTGLGDAIQGLNGWLRPYYRGPAPPAGTPHLYHFTIYALDEVLGLEPGLTRDDLLEAMEGHILGRGDLVPIYERFSGTANL